MHEPAADVTEDTLLGGTVRLLQPRSGHRAGTDAVLLAAAAAAMPARRVVDLGSASGAVGLQMCRRNPEVRLLFVDDDPALIALCRQNIGLNGFEAQATATTADALASPEERLFQGLRPGEADLVVTNPPFFEDAVRRSPDPARRRAHVMGAGGLDGWVRTTAWLLAPKGALCIIHRADHLAECLQAISGAFGGIAITPIHPALDRPASRILLTARKGARGPLRLDPPLVLHEADGRFTDQVQGLHRL